MSAKLYTPADLRRSIPRPVPSSFNSGLTSPSADWMEEFFGSPELKATQRKLKIVTESVGPFKVTGMAIAVLGLRHIFEDVKEAGRTDLLTVKTDGMYNLRKIREREEWSNHSWGCAVDINFGDGEEMGDGLIQFGLREIYPFFHARKWYSGLGYKNREDAMHMEPSVELLELWRQLGLL